MPKQILHSLALALIFSLPVSEIRADFTAACASQGGSLFRNRCFMFPNLPKTFFDAESACTALPNGHLAIVNSMELLTQMKAKISAELNPNGAVVTSAQRQTPSVSVSPTIGSDDGWFYRYKGQLYGPMPLKNQGWTNFWNNANNEPDQIGSDCLYLKAWFGSLSPGVGGFNDKLTTNSALILCEYRPIESNFKQLISLNNQRVVDAAVFQNVTVPHKLRCVKLCAENWVCASFGFHPITKECRLAMIYENEDSILYEPANGYEFFTHDY